MPYTLNVNGRSTTVDVPADMPLLWVIRDVLNLKGTKFGCGIGQCGACTVHLRGRAVRSCQTPVSAAANAPITTLEGLSADGTHPLQIAWREIDVPQCGYCQAGQIMSAAALLATTPKPSDDDIDRAMNGNVCRCGTYVRIREAIHKAAAMPPRNAPQTARAERVSHDHDAPQSSRLPQSHRAGRRRHDGRHLHRSADRRVRAGAAGPGGHVRAHRLRQDHAPTTS